MQFIKSLVSEVIVLDILDRRIIDRICLRVGLSFPETAACPVKDRPLSLGQAQAWAYLLARTKTIGDAAQLPLTQAVECLVAEVVVVGCLDGGIFGHVVLLVC